MSIHKSTQHKYSRGQAPILSFPVLTFTNPLSLGSRFPQWGRLWLWALPRASVIPCLCQRSSVCLSSPALHPALCLELACMDSTNRLPRPLASDLFGQGEHEYPLAGVPRGWREGTREERIEGREVGACSPLALPAGSPLAAWASELDGYPLLPGCHLTVICSSPCPFRPRAGSGYQLLLVALYCTNPGHFPTPCPPLHKESSFETLQMTQFEWTSCCWDSVQILSISNTRDVAVPPGIPSVWYIEAAQ